MFLKPGTVEEACSILTEYKGNALIIGGGTEIYELSQRGFLKNIEVLVDLSKLRLQDVKEEEFGLLIGASVTLTELEQRKDLYNDSSLSCLLDALTEIRPIQVKNSATISGAICSCVPYFDLPVALAALDSIVVIKSIKEERRVPVAVFQRDFLQSDLKEGELVTAILIPRNKNSVSAFSKFALTADDWAIVNCACSTTFSQGRISKSSVVFGAISNRLFIAEKTSEALMGSKLDPDAIEDAGELLDKELIEITDDIKASAKYRRRLAKILLKQTLEKISLRTEAG